ncbi:hypothetical protein PUR34_00630, partial [Streptomyces sp. JV185]|uniref:hypothetical protein n=1 Tax=Streptomyces sp. JV185 TaxID=858638 RepID=UPI002E769183
ARVAVRMLLGGLLLLQVVRVNMHGLPRVRRRGGLRDVLAMVVVGEFGFVMGFGGVFLGPAFEGCGFLYFLGLKNTYLVVAMLYFFLVFVWVGVF